jgi:hypothetical protein
MDLKKEQLKNKIVLLLKDFLREVYNKPSDVHYYLPDKYSKKIMKEIEEWKTL